jgi:hypothetical protein
MKIIGQSLILFSFELRTKEILHSQSIQAPALVYFDVLLQNNQKKPLWWSVSFVALWYA